MKSYIFVFAVALMLFSLSYGETPAPGPLTIEFGCQCVRLYWGAADSAGYHPDGYIIYRAAETRYDWTQITSHLITDTTYTDYDLVIGDLFNYAVVAHYPEGNSGMSIGECRIIDSPSGYDYFIVGTDSSIEINWWYKLKLDSLGLVGTFVEDLLPYCGDMLADLPLLVVVDVGEGWAPLEGDQERESVIADYLDRGGRLYSHDAYQTYSAMLSEEYLGYGFTTCMPYAFMSIHGVSGTFSQGLRYSFSDTLFSSNMGPAYFDSTEAYVILEDDVQCGCVDMAINRQGYKAVINSQPLNLSTGHDTTGSMLTYFERMLEFFDILSGVDEDAPENLPERLSLFAYPNPFNACIKIRLVNCDLKNDQVISIFDISGRHIRELTMPRAAGEVIWDGRDSGGQMATSGVYFAKFSNSELSASIKITLLK